MGSTWPKACSCGATFTREQWLALPAKGIGMGLDYRDCPECREPGGPPNTMAVPAEALAERRAADQ